MPNQSPLQERYVVSLLALAEELAEDVIANDRVDFLDSPCKLLYFLAPTLTTQLKQELKGFIPVVSEYF